MGLVIIFTACYSSLNFDLSVLKLSLCCYRDTVFSPEELIGMIFNNSRHLAEEYAGMEYNFPLSLPSHDCTFVSHVMA